MNKTFFWREKNKLRKSKESMCQVIKDEYRMKYRKEYFEGFLNVRDDRKVGGGERTGLSGELLEIK